jgi:hypothetical protein
MRLSLWKFVRNYGLLILWLVAAFLLYSWYQSDYQLEHSIAGLPRERNYDVPYRMTDGKLVLLTLAIMTAELIILYLILRPWSYRHSSKHLLIALTLFMTLMLFSSLRVFGTNNYVMFHWLWLLTVNCVLIVCGIISGISILVMKGDIRTR